MREEILNYLKEILMLKDERESAAVQRILAEHIDKHAEGDWKTIAVDCIERLSRGEPVQYITGYTWFYDLKLKVSRHVLIPRPETEELVAWIMEDRIDGLIRRSPEILDIGTGSGCIALALKKRMPDAHVVAIDVSQEALLIANENAAANDLHVEFIEMDFLKSDIDRKYDVIVSNPPYVSEDEFHRLSLQVRDHEPVIALKPESGDPFAFYRRLVEIGKKSLNEGGKIYMELNEFRAYEIRALFVNAGYDTDLRKDMQGKWRMLKAG